MYYCKTRYYNPEWCRWLNSDDVSYLDPKNINGLNLYYYCNNNPILYVDHEGAFPVPVWSSIIGLLKDIFIGFGTATLNASLSAFSHAANIPMYLGSGSIGAWGSSGLVSGTEVVLNPAYKIAMDNATKMSRQGNIMNSFGKIAKVGAYSLLAIDCGLSIYNNFSNPNLSKSRQWTDSVVDVGFSIGSFIVAAKFGAAIGSIGGPVGIIIGAGAGFLIGLGIYYFQKTDMYNDIKVGFNMFITGETPNSYALSSYGGGGGGLRSR